MPTPDIPPRKLRRDVGGRSFAPGFRKLRLPRPPGPKKRRGKSNPDEGGVPVEPDRPKTLSGGAAVALDFEEG